MDIKKAATVDEYISQFPEPVQKKLKKLRETIVKAVPEAVEKIGYGMPAYNYKGVLIYFAAHTSHISIYPFPSAMEAFNKEIAAFRTSKGTMQFHENEEIPFKLVTEIVKFRKKENEEKTALKKKPRK
jgi:uncharacterized protein YdhG (YjbR/CyaY superfamily)